MTEYVALLRGINVGGNNLIKMTALKACFEEQGFEAVMTYIQSGNVLFRAAGSSEKLARQIESAMKATFGCTTMVVLRSLEQMRTIVEHAPKGFGAAPAKLRYDVLFLKEPLTAASAIKVVPTRPGVDQVYGGKGVLYFARLISKATQSRLSKLVSLPIYKSVTIRNFNTTTKLLQLMVDRSSR